MIQVYKLKMLKWMDDAALCNEKYVTYACGTWLRTFFFARAKGLWLYKSLEGDFNIPGILTTMPQLYLIAAVPLGVIVSHNYFQVLMGDITKIKLQQGYGQFVTMGQPNTDDTTLRTVTVLTQKQMELFAGTI